MHFLFMCLSFLYFYSKRTRFVEFLKSKTLDNKP